MYIHNYQIHNVLNAYRKQLSQPANAQGSKRANQPSPKDMISLSQQGQQPSIVNKISAEIVDRISQFGPQSEFENALADQFTAQSTDRPRQTAQNGSEFTYTLIDEQNRKRTHSLPIQGLNTQTKPTVIQDTPSPNKAMEQPQAKGLFDNHQETSKKWKG